VSGRQEDNRDHRRAAEEVQPEVDLYAEVSEPNIELTLSNDERNHCDQPTMADRRAGVSHHEYCLNTAHAAIAKPITAT
jgi:hypothetical protein